MPRSEPSRDEFAADVRAGLTGDPKRLHPKYFYDSLGSSLFEAICRLPWYRITRAECGLLTGASASLASELWQAGGRPDVVELGCGNGEKLEVLARALVPHGGACVHLVDVSAQALAHSARRLRLLLGFDVFEHQADYERGLRAAANVCGRGGGMLLVLFLGSNIGNFDGPSAQRFLHDIHASMPAGALLLLGVDLVKPEHELLLAYDDPLGVTAAFNKNVLVRINAELGADFDVSRFDHLARWNAADQRVEMHLVSRITQTVHLPDGLVVPFAAGERIWTESSHKYTPGQIDRMGHDAGFTTRSRWIDDAAKFALTLFAA